MTKFTQSTFSVACSSCSVPEDELARRWQETFGKKKPEPETDEAIDFSGEDMMPIEDACEV